MYLIFSFLLFRVVPFPSVVTLGELPTHSPSQDEMELKVSFSFLSIVLYLLGVS